MFCREVKDQGQKSLAIRKLICGVAVRSFSVGRKTDRCEGSQRIREKTQSTYRTIMVAEQLQSV